jgi:hypothetical protein
MRLTIHRYEIGTRLAQSLSIRSDASPADVRATGKSGSA